MKVSLFITCLCDLLTPEVGKDSVMILERLGCDVDFPTDQTCCGQPAFNSGYMKPAKKAMQQTSEDVACIALIYPICFTYQLVKTESDQDHRKHR